MTDYRIIRSHVHVIRSIFLSLVVTAFIFSGVSVANAKQDNANNELETHTTPDGHQFTYHHMADANRAAISIAWKGGFAGVPIGKENIAYFGPLMMTDGGAGGKKPDELAAEFEALDAGAHLYSEVDAIRGFVVAPADDLPKSAEIANNVLARPHLDARWLDRFKRQKKKHYLDSSTQVGYQAWKVLRAAINSNPRYMQAWTWHPPENIDSISIDDIKDWHKQSISTNDLVIAVAGNVSVKDAAGAIDIALADLPDTNKRKNLQPLALEFSGKTIVVHKPDADKSFLLIAGALPSQNHPQDLAHTLAVGVLGQSKHSRLFKTVRDEQRAAYRFGSGKFPFAKSHEVLALHGEVETEKLPKVIAAVEIAYEKFTVNGIGITEFPIAKRIMLNRTREQAEKPSTIAFMMTENELRGLDQSLALSIVARTEELDRSAVNKAIAANFPAITEMTRIIVTPNQDIIEADCLIDDLSSLDQCK